MSDDEELLLERETYLANGVHIGTKSQHNDMKDYIFHVKKNQLAVLNLEDTDKQTRKAAKKLAEYNPEDVLVVGRKEEATKALDEFSNVTGVDSVIGRFMPGTLTNPESDSFTEPELVIVTDPETDAQAIVEAEQTNKYVIAIADSENELEGVDMAIPANNKSAKSLGLVYYLIANQLGEQTGEDYEIEREDFQEETVDREEDEDEE
jgi:small subunit ribosomal protein S2